MGNLTSGGNDVSAQITAPVSDLSEDKIASLLAAYDIVKVAMQDGNWTKEIHVPAASPANRGRTVTIDHTATYDSVLSINGREVKVPRGFKKSYTPTGNIGRRGRWRTSRSNESRRPSASQ